MVSFLKFIFATHSVGFLWRGEYCCYYFSCSKDAHLSSLSCLFYCHNWLLLKRSFRHLDFGGCQIMCSAVLKDNLDHLNIYPYKSRKSFCLGLFLAINKNVNDFVFPIDYHLFQKKKKKMKENLLKKTWINIYLYTKESL